MKSRAVRLLGALGGPGAILFCIAVACEPQDIYLFDESALSREDAGSEPEPDPLPSEDEPDPPAEPDAAAPPARTQPVCLTEACDACVVSGDCLESSGFFCHPETGECRLSCDPDASEAQTCNAPESCDPRIGLCVECVDDDDCSYGAGAVCDTRRGQCVECLPDADTCSGTRRICDPGALRCVECLNDNQCGPGSVCLPGPQRCAQCASNADCRGLEDDVFCLPGPQICVECIDDDDCTEDPRKPFCSSENECEDERE
ncbi:MAG TPA: hypothetical protein VMG12_07455 [Polyangiaceae bacterium]|nr:hypothetical protein [Polyangiaceae bacterium]